MNQFEIWSEGYICNGDSGGAHFHGYAQGEDFKSACASYAEINEEFNQYFNYNRMTYWGCRLFDNRYEASKSFG